MIALRAGLALAYPFLVLVGLQWLEPRHLALVAGGVVATRFALPRRRRGPSPGHSLTCAGGATVGFYCIWVRATGAIGEIAGARRRREVSEATGRAPH